MELIYDIKKLKKLLYDFYKISNIRVAVFNDKIDELASYPEELPEFCKTIRSTINGVNACKRCDKEACLKAKVKNTSISYYCHAGLLETAFPIIENNNILGYILFGSLSPKENEEEGWKIVKEKCKNLNIDKTKLYIAFKKQHYFPADYIESATNLMNTIASYMCITHIAELKNESIPYLFSKYINGNIDQEIEIKKLAEYLHVGKTKLNEISRLYFGMSPLKYINYLKMKKATTLLKNNALPIKEVSNQVGISDYNYFTKVFKSYYKVTPREYRKNF